MIYLVVVLWLWFTRYVGGSPKMGLRTIIKLEIKDHIPSKKSRDRTDQL